MNKDKIIINITYMPKPSLGDGVLSNQLTFVRILF